MRGVSKDGCKRCVCSNPSRLAAMRRAPQDDGGVCCGVQRNVGWAERSEPTILLRNRKSLICWHYAKSAFAEAGRCRMFDPFDLKNLNFIEFDRGDLLECEMAHALATMTMNWGRIETYIFAIVVSIDFNRKDWATDFFKVAALDARKKAAERAIRKALEKSYPEFITILNGVFDRLQVIQNRRNLLAHGVWSRGTSPSKFIVRPLRLQSNTSGFLEEPIEVDRAYVGNIVNDMHLLSQTLASLGSEMMAHQQLKKWGKR